MKTVAIVINNDMVLGEFLKENLISVFGQRLDYKVVLMSQCNDVIDADVVLVMTRQKMVEIIPFVDDVRKIITVKRTISHDAIDAIKAIEPQKVLVVNDDYETTIELMASIYQMGCEHLQLIPNHGDQELVDVRVAITANERRLVPQNLSVVDIGYRPIDLLSYVQIAEALGIPLTVVTKAIEKNDMQRVESHTLMYHYLEQYKTVQKLSSLLAKKSQQSGFHAKYTFADIIHQSKKMQDCIVKAKKLSDYPIDVLIYGESGTGKELVAQSMHNYSERAHSPFVAVNVTAIPQHLIESEMFGYEEGAFTGAIKGGKMGLFERCHGGTLFLDEIGDMPLDFQAKLLRVIQEGSIMPVGSNRQKNVDVRLITATNKDIGELIKQGKFREDLYYRIKGAILRIPPLREREEDIALLLATFMDGKHLSDEVDVVLRSHEWMGNVRELKQACEYMKIMAEDDVMMTHLPDDISVVSKHVAPPLSMIHYEKYRWILEVINTRSLLGKSSGRLTIVDECRKKGLIITESEVKSGLKYLAKEGYIHLQKGSKGSVLTQKGLNLLNTKRT